MKNNNHCKQQAKNNETPGITMTITMAITMAEQSPVSRKIISVLLPRHLGVSASRSTQKTRRGVPAGLRRIFP
jgi:hypothetical protein